MSLEFLIELNRNLRKWDYGIVYRDKKIFNPSDADYWDKYVTLTPGLFELYKCGTCFDYVAYQHTVLKENKIKHDSFYIESGKEECHTYTVCKIDKVFYWFEASDKRNAGIYAFNTIDAAASYANDKSSTDWNSRRIATFKYDPSVKLLTSVSCQKFMDYFKYQKPFNVSNSEYEPIKVIK